MQLSFGSIFGKVSTPKFRESNGACTEICNGGSMACSFVGRNQPGSQIKKVIRFIIGEVNTPKDSPTWFERTYHGKSRYT